MGTSQVTSFNFRCDESQYLQPGIGGLALSSSTSKASKKKGLCIPPGKNFHCGDLEAFSHVSWWYNWHTQPNHVDEDKCTCDTAPDCGPEPDQPAFVPMIWGYHEDNPWHDDESDPVAGKYHTMQTNQILTLRLQLLLG